MAQTTPTPVPQVHNPLEQLLWTDIFGNFRPPNNGGTPSYLGINQNAAGQGGLDILGIDAAIKELEKTFNDNLPSYAVGVFGLILIGAGVYSLAK